jgi:Protein of unknown function (DUF3263)
MGARRGLPGGKVAGLSERDMRILAFERSWWRLAGAKERDILEVFSVPVTRYYQLLNELIDRPEAAAFDPVLVTRLRRQRSRRQRMRSARPD